jgi:hypothetical protein
MAQRSPTAEGFPAIIRTPSLWIAEVAWRWAFGISAGVLLFLAVCEFLASVKVSTADALFLRSGNPALNAAVLARILQGSAPRLLLMAAVLLPLISGLWVFASALGRAATLKVMLRKTQVRLQPMLGLSFLRAALIVAAFAALIGAVRAAAVTESDAAKAVLILAAVAIVFVWSVLNRLLSLAAVCAESNNTIGAIISAIRLWRDRPRALAATGFWFGLLHMLAAAGAFTGALFALGLLTVSGWATLIVLGFVLVAYSAVADFFYIARLAAYAVILEDETPSEPARFSANPFSVA